MLTPTEHNEFLKAALREALDRLQTSRQKSPEDVARIEELRKFLDG